VSLTYRDHLKALAALAAPVSARAKDEGARGPAVDKLKQRCVVLASVL
jgi:hypothetical protein